MADGTVRKIALVISGAVSLGSFEAGVVYELIRHIREKRDPVLEIDVIVGTSAGALTGALAALVLAFNYDPRILEESWLSVKLDDLLKLNPQDKSILSSSKVEELIAKYISPPAKASSLPAGNPINLDIVVTNLDGIKYAIHRAKGGEFAIEAIGYEDFFQFKVDAGFRDWDRLQTAVRASSAFPGAFEDKVVVRREQEFPGRFRSNFSAEGLKPFHYSDGGIVNNQPLSRAIEAVNNLVESAARRAEDRVFLVVDPAPPHIPPYLDNYGAFDVITKAVWTIPRNQTLYKDLLLVEKANRRIGWKNSFVRILADVMASKPIPEESLMALRRLCEAVAEFKGRTILDMDAADYLRAEEDRIRKAYDRDVQKAANREFFIKYCFMLEQVADLRDKREISLEMITPRNAAQELAGVIFGSFGGFLDSEFMKHDFQVGRRYAERWLKKEQDFRRGDPIRKLQVSPAVKRRMARKLFDNSIPLLVEEIGPKLMSGVGGTAANPKEKLTLTGIFLFSFGKYMIKRTVSRAKKTLFSSRTPQKKRQ